METEAGPPPPPLGRVWRWVGMAYALLMAVGLTGYAVRPRVIETPERQPGTAAAEVRANLAHVAQGASVRVSSFMGHAHHHPMYLIDGETRPTAMEKWVAAEDDAAPWARVALRARARVEAVELELAGAHGERIESNQANYEVVCLVIEGGEERVTQVVDVVGNLADRPRTELGCEADAVRVRFSVGPERSPQRLVKVYELRVLGAWL